MSHIYNVIHIHINFYKESYSLDECYFFKLKQALFRFLKFIATGFSFQFLITIRLNSA